MRRARLAITLGTPILSVMALAGPVAVASVPAAVPSHRGILPPKHPSRSLKASPNYPQSRSCVGGQDGRACNSLALKAIARARKVLERMGGMSFSLSAYERLRPIEQLFVTVDLERVARGLAPAVVLTRSLDKVAQVGANKDEDPPLQNVPRRLPGGGRPSGLGGNWAGGLDNALGSDYAWMYDDGLGSANLDCTRSNRSGCWGHRDNILGTFNRRATCGGGRNELAMGAGHVRRGRAFGDSETELLAGICGPTPTDVVLSWARAKSLLHVKF